MSKSVLEAADVFRIAALRMDDARGAAQEAEHAKVNAEMHLMQCEKAFQEAKRKLLELACNGELIFP